VHDAGKEPGSLQSGPPDSCVASQAIFSGVMLAPRSLMTLMMSLMNPMM
jgi:hypothetical protein